MAINPLAGIIQAASTASTQPYEGDSRPYGNYTHVTDHDYDPGILVLPVASQGSKTVKVRVHGGYSTRRVAFDVSRAKNPPIIPKPEDVVGAERDDLLLECRISTPLPHPNPSTGELDWKVSGEYLFATKGRESVSVTSVPPTTASTVTTVDATTGKTTTVVTTAGGEVTTTVLPSAARKPAREMLPLGGYPFSMGLADAVGSAIFSSGASLAAISSIQGTLVADNNHKWPFTILPPFIFNGNLLKE